ncbi:MAG: ABC transporter permease [Rhodocyclaceae bacterium]|nr:ABC transporter permease [Rhodocyclaceae bacterium]
MLAEIFRRALVALVTLWAVLTLSYVCLYTLPGDPARIILGPQASAESIQDFRRSAGLDGSWWQQYASYLRRLINLDLGDSFALRRPVASLIAERGQVSLKLAGAAFAVVLAVSILTPLGLKSVGANSALFAIEFGAQITAFAPPYVLAIVSLLVVGGCWGLVPIIFDAERAGSWWLAAGVLSAYPAALLLRVFGTELDAQMRRPYALRARASGFSTTRTLWREALPNAVPVALAALANSLAFFVTGAFFVEIVFGVPGLGRLGQDALRQRDVALLAGVCIAFSAFVVVLGLVLDLLIQQRGPWRKDH